MKTTEMASSSLPVEPDFFCWSTWIATAPARWACTPGGGLARVIAARRLPTSVVSPSASPWPTLDSTCSCSACPSADRPRSLTLTTVGVLLRSFSSVPSQVTSDAVSFPGLAATITGTGVRVPTPNGSARSVACWLGALAGRKLALFPWVTLASDGRKRGTATAAMTHATRMNQRNLTANEPSAPNIPSIDTRRIILAANCDPAEPLLLEEFAG